ncbi:hypothetical protein A2U01_0108083 [Trifolium medium]|uniref:Uncharacterized protein n=1 Tax=Trifolium medium TaxID=97028 RepID=A0A392VHA7_9FABA|nr:hypothetical protein [Trifolium medium]
MASSSLPLRLPWSPGPLLPCLSRDRLLDYCPIVARLFGAGLFKYFSSCESFVWNSPAT